MCCREVPALPVHDHSVEFLAGVAQLQETCLPFWRKSSKTAVDVELVLYVLWTGYALGLAVSIIWILFLILLAPFSNLEDGARALARSTRAARVTRGRRACVGQGHAEAERARAGQGISARRVRIVLFWHGRWLVLLKQTENLGRCAGERRHGRCRCIVRWVSVWIGIVRVPIPDLTLIHQIGRAHV